MQRHISDIADRIRWGAIAVAAAATLGVGGMAAAGGSEPAALQATGSSILTPTDPYSTCLRRGSMSADRIERRSSECRLRVEDLLDDPAFMACIRSAARTPDAVERWFEACRIATQR